MKIIPAHSFEYNLPMSLWTGKTIGKVYIEELIARGGMAEVYLGEHSTLGRKIAVKVMRDHVDDDPDTFRRFEREAQVIASLRHPNIVQMYDYELSNGQPCLFMEYVSGPSLSAYLKNLHQRGKKLPLEMVNHLLHPLADALDYAHNQGLVHRDIKPANVLLRSEEKVDLDHPLPGDVEPILTDFGLVRMLDSTLLTATGTVAGTPAYMSPEQARGEKVGPFTDIYSLGVVLYEMLAGVVPFEADSTFGVLMKHLNDPPPPIFGISSDMQALIDRALAKEPDMRYATAKEMADEFTKIFSGETASSDTIKIAKAARKSAPSVKGKYSRTLRWAYVGIGLLAVVGFVFAAYVNSRNVTVDPNQPVGTVRFADFNYVLDKATIRINGLPPPHNGMHYEAWFLAEGGETIRNIGKITLNGAGQGELTFIDPDSINLLGAFDQIEITEEKDGSTNAEKPSGEVVASFIYPPLALPHVRHILVAFDSAPDQTELIQGLWYSADGVSTSTTELQKAYADENESLVRKKTEEIINQLVGEADTNQFRDWDGDGIVDNPGDGFGLLGDGYLPMTISHAQYAIQAADATGNIQMHGGHVLTCLENMQGWSEQLLEKALQLQKMPFGADMEPLIHEMISLAEKIVSGVDANGNEIIEPIVGEGGADTAYEHAYYMADMSLFSGKDRIPPPAATESPK